METQHKHTNGALATSTPLLTNPTAISPSVDLLPVGFAESLRPMVRQFIHNEITNIIREEIQFALTGQTAPAFNYSAPPSRITNAMKQCKSDGCRQAVRSKGFCSAHYQNARRSNLKAQKLAGKSRGKKR